MKVLIQRVSSASVKVNGTVISSIGRGILAFVGVEKGDTEAEARWCAEKTVHLRIFADEGGRMNLSLLETGGELLAVSQFTLCAEVSRGRRPGYDRAEAPGQAKILYEHFIACCREKIPRVLPGVFQAMMEVSLINDGPVTFIIEKDPPLEN